MDDFESVFWEREKFLKKRTFNRAEREFWLIVGWGELEGIKIPDFLLGWC